MKIQQTSTCPELTTRTKNKQTTTWEVFQSLQEKRKNALNLTFLLLTLNMYLSAWTVFIATTRSKLQ